MTDQTDLRETVSQCPNGSILTISVTPKASANRLELRSDGTICVRVTAPPLDGAANEALLKFLSKKLDIPRSRLSIVSGGSTRHKRVQARDVTPTELCQRLQRALASNR